ncbi:MAG: FecR domain-containing protein [Elusimicrobiota bacterium]|nr:FecR domain-containing protein [Elusimicrobiota bacterium]
MPPVRVFALAALFCAVSGSVRAAVLREATGLVQIRPAGADSWRPAGKAPRPMSEGDGLRTGFNAKARVELHAGSVLEAEGNAHVSIEVDGPGHTSIHAMFGTVRLSASAGGGRAVSVRTPTCVVRARGDRVVTRITVAGGGSATIEVVEGVAGVEDNRGTAIILRAGQRVAVDLAGVHEATAAPTPVQARKIDFMATMRRELGFELGRDADFTAASREARRGERELGRVLIDADGRRVRVEEYVVRPSDSRLSLVVMNGRPEGLSYYSWDGRFDRALPRNLEAVFAGLTGSAAATAWTVTDFTATWATGGASLAERGSGGHQVDLNANADPLDDVAAGTAFRTIFDRYGVYANGVLKRGFTGANLQTYSDAAASSTNDPLTGAALGANLPVVVINTTFPDGASARRVTREAYGDGTTITREDLALEFGGGVAPRASYGSPDRHREQRITVGGAVIRVVMPSDAAAATRQVP